MGHPRGASRLVRAGFNRVVVSSLSSLGNDILAVALHFNKLEAPA
jgi:hypothetical protein